MIARSDWLLGSLSAVCAQERYTQKSNWNGYDPALQGKTGLMTRFGPHDPALVAKHGAGAGTPNFHGVASCVDYLTGYMAAWSGVRRPLEQPCGPSHHSASDRPVRVRIWCAARRFVFA